VADSPQTDTEPANARRRTSRTYYSPLREKRAAETRDAVLDAAHHSFISKGWFGTGMRDVARAAGVATETLYGHFSSKRVLFEHVIDVALVDGAVDAIEQRPEFAAIGDGRHADRARAAARLFNAMHGRAIALAKVMREAAATDEEIAQMLQAARDRQRDDIAKTVELIIGREPTVAERDGVWVLTSPEVYLLLVENSGWSANQYESWMADTLERILPKARGRRRQRQ
jgi:AcrR family transcriptional regulator